MNRVDLGELPFDQLYTLIGKPGSVCGILDDIEEDFMIEKTEGVSVFIPLKEYEQLKEESRRYQSLIDAGVDNWEWYGEAMDDYDEKYGHGYA